MKKLSKLFSDVKDYNDELFLKVEKITLINRKKCYIQNYHEMLEIQEDLIKLTNIAIKGKHLKINSISKYFLEVTGEIEYIELRDDSHEK